MLIWAVVYIVSMGLYAYGILNSISGEIIMLIAGAIVAYIAGRNLNSVSVGGILKYSIGWVIIAFILDVLLTVPYSGWALYSEWSVWVGYALVLVAPTLAVKKSAA